ncbi:hypothetical protein, partial [Stutzerimonas kunmingensis]|uniref:hypothetical protein n=1 Tax=Stutzerimonas kunmingensis TaxID=1211807 RepID=UPI0028AF0E29
QHRTGKVRCCTQFLPPPSSFKIDIGDFITRSLKNAGDVRKNYFIFKKNNLMLADTGGDE